MPERNFGSFKERYIFAPTLIVLIAGSLTMSGLLINRTLTPLFLFLLGVCLLALLSSTLIIRAKTEKAIIFVFFTPLVLMFTYVMVNGYFINKDFNTYHIYLVACCTLIFAAAIAFKKFNKLSGTFFSIAMIAGLIEAGICFLQFGRIISSNSPFFAVTGSWDNPNVTAMFIVMAIPAVISQHEKAKQSLRLITVMSFVGMALALVLLDCRSALVGLAFILLINLDNKIHFLRKFRSQPVVIKLVNVLILTIIIGATALILFQHKSASSKSRSHIWSTSMGLIMEKPWLGHGYGFFERDFNRYQANIVEADLKKGVENHSVGYVFMAYNEYIQQGVEGGLIGFLLWSTLLCTVIYLGYMKQYLQPIDPGSKSLINGREIAVRNEEHLAAHSGIIAFAVMSAVNFTIQAIPVMCMFLIYCAIIFRDVDGNGFFKLNLKPWRLNSKPLGYTLLVACTILMIAVSTSLYANYQNKQATDYAKANDVKKSIALLNQLSGKLYRSESYWTNYARVLIKAKEYPKALYALKKAKNLSSRPEIFMTSGYVNEKIGNFAEARRNYLMAVFLEPQQLKARSALMMMAEKTGNIADAINFAKDILAQPLKVNNARAYNIRSAARNKLAKYGINSDLTVKPRSMTFTFSDH